MANEFDKYISVSVVLRRWPKGYLEDFRNKGYDCYISGDDIIINNLTAPLANDVVALGGNQPSGFNTIFYL
jgi:hypothetical protein